MRRINSFDDDNYKKPQFRKGGLYDEINPYSKNPNVVSLIWNRSAHGFDEDDSDFDQMAREGYDSGPAKRIVAELNALSKSMNFDDKPPEPNWPLLICLCCLLVFPAIIYHSKWEDKFQKFLENERRFRAASKALVQKHNESLLQNSRYYVEIGECYPHVLAIHLIRPNQMVGNPHNPLIVMNNPNMMMASPGMMM